MLATWRDVDDLGAQMLALSVDLDNILIEVECRIQIVHTDSIVNVENVGIMLDPVSAVECGDAFLDFSA